MEVVSTGREARFTSSYRWDNERHRHERYDIFQCGLSGSGVFEYRRDGELRRERIQAGRMFIASWQEPFAYWFEGREPWEFLWITLAGEFADRVAAELGRITPIISLPAGSAPFAILASLQDRLAGPVALDRYALSCVGFEFLVQLAKLADRGIEDEEGRFIAEAREFAARRITSADLPSLARHFGYAEKYFIG
ncbi:MAG: AraC family ligand binding domain-containing protein, partial [Spirochaetaceae bacterium]|nr:AraC family ligand binding domain-containing protein [Spirochaetaceae bacterium]